MQTCSSGSVTTSDELPVALGKKAKTKWTVADEAALIESLFQRKHLMTDNSMFKDGVFREAAIEVDCLRGSGAPKSAESCKSKWSKVYCSFICAICILTRMND